jgi:ATP-dependent Clp protease ATP-binding subunit ClpX
MFKIPSMNNVSKVVIDAAVINGDSEPLLVYETEPSSITKVAD